MVVLLDGKGDRGVRRIWLISWWPATQKKEGIWWKIEIVRRSRRWAQPTPPDGVDHCARRIQPSSQLSAGSLYVLLTVCFSSPATAPDTPPSVAIITGSSHLRRPFAGLRRRTGHLSAQRPLAGLTRQPALASRLSRRWGARAPAPLQSGHELFRFSLRVSWLMYATYLLARPTVDDHTVFDPISVAVQKNSCVGSSRSAIHWNFDPFR
jgi:hypothetical protein